MQPKYATLRDVAKHAKTSTATVSYVLNDVKGRYVSAELRERVLNSAKELHYVKSVFASGLRGQHRGIIGITFPQFTNIFFSRLALAVEQIANEHGYLVTICNTFEDPERERAVLEAFLQQRIDGLLLIPVDTPTNNLDLIEHIGIPSVIVERPLLGAPLKDYNYVGMDNFNTAYLATKSLIERGHRNIAFTTWHANTPSLQERQRGYRVALAEANIPVRDDFIFHGAFSAQAGAENTLEFIQTVCHETTALVYGYHVHAQGGLPVLRDHGVRIPEDLSVIVLGDPEWVDLHTPSLTHMTLPATEIGTKAAQVLFERIAHKGNYTSTVTDLIVGSLVEGNSIKTV